MELLRLAPLGLSETMEIVAFVGQKGLELQSLQTQGAPFDVLDQSLFVSSTGTFNAYGAGLFLGNGVTIEAGASGIIKGCFIDAVSNLRF